MSTPSTLSSAKQADQQFYRSVLQQAQVTRVANVHRLQHNVGPSRHNAVLQLWASDWIIRRGDAEIKVHLEARKRGELRLEVDIVPYIPRIESKPSELKQHRASLALKARMLGQLRDRVMRDAACLGLGATTSRLHPTDQIATATTVKFDQGLERGCSVEACADYFAKVVACVVPAVSDTVAACD